MYLQSILYGNPDYYPPMIHGATVLDRNGFQQQILSYRFRSQSIPAEAMDNYYPPSTRVLRLGPWGKRSWQAFLAFALDVLQQNNNRAELFIGYNMQGFALAKLLAARYRKPLVYHCHDFVENHAAVTVGDRVFKALERRFARTANLVIVPDHERAEVMVEQLGLREFPLIVANCPVSAPDAQSNLLRATLAQQGKHFERIVWRQGMINQMHGLEVTLRSMPLWASPNWGFVIMGPGDERYKQSLVRLAEQIGVADRFVILPAVGDYRDVARYTVGADVGHALYEPFQVNHKFITTASNKTMEYQAAGLPMLLADTSGGRALVAKYQNAVLVDVTAPQAIAEGINQILSNPEYARQLAAGSQRAFREEFNYETQYRPAIECFKALIAAR